MDDNDFSENMILAREQYRYSKLVVRHDIAYGPNSLEEVMPTK